MKLIFFWFNLKYIITFISLIRFTHSNLDWKTKNSNPFLSTMRRKKFLMAFKSLIWYITKSIPMINCGNNFAWKKNKKRKLKRNGRQGCFRFSVVGKKLNKEQDHYYCKVSIKQLKTRTWVLLLDLQWLTNKKKLRIISFYYSTSVLKITI